jgi:hypothetical protein
MAHRLKFKDFLSFSVQLGLDKTSANGFEEDGPTLGIKLGIGLTFGVKLAASTGSPHSKNQPTTKNEAKHT